MLRAPGAVAEADQKALAELVLREGTYPVIISLAKELAERDLQCTRLQQELEQAREAFRTHLKEEHDLSQREADERARSLSPSLRHAPRSLPGLSAHQQPKDYLEYALSSASSDNLRKGTSNNFESTDLLIPRNQSGREDSSTIPRDNASGKPYWTRMFGGTGTFRGKPAGDRSISSVLAQTAPQPTKTTKVTPTKANTTDRRLSTALLQRTPTTQSMKPVEMDAVVEFEHLPPPLVEIRVTAGQYRDYIADNYGFIFDKTRIIASLEQSNSIHKAQRVLGMSSSNLAALARTRSTTPELQEERPQTSDSNSSSLKRVSTQDRKQTSWTEYLQAQASTALGRISSFPVVSFQLNTAAESESSSDDLSRVESNDDHSSIDFNEEAKLLRAEINVEFTTQEEARRNACTEFLQKHGQAVETGFLKSFTLRGRPQAKDVPLENTMLFGVGDLARASSAKRIALKTLVLGGLPMAMRAKIWLEKAKAFITLTPNEFSLLASEETPEAHHWMASIDADIPRTLTSNVFFRAGDGRQRVEQILKAFANRKPQTGYCQGMHIVAGFLVLALPTTEQAFTVFCHVIEHILPSRYFDDGQSVGAAIDVVVLRIYIRKLLPASPRTWTNSKYQTRRPYQSAEAVYRVWDVVLSIPKQDTFLLRVAIAMLKLHETALLELPDQGKLYAYLDRNMAGVDTSIDGLIQASWQLRQLVKEEDVARARNQAAHV
ncbi:hypothetical protein H2203_000852 [Taxawa tesnikishii (nom. ined.)]|nr:hypothetical protein H2203_000852 [Dothideales sp. JES 119]